jgi:apolipoprotein D and lipocalin family protein
MRENNIIQVLPSKLILSLILLLSLTACSSSMKTLKTVPGVDLNRYTGKWYEIARLPNSFETGLVCCTAEYGIRPDGKISVINRGVKETDPAKTSSVTGKAWVPDPGEPGRLKVQFFWPFAAGYYIFHLDEKNYQYALVGTPSRKYLWILARQPQIDEALYRELIDIAKKNDFSVEGVIKVDQSCNR